MVRSCYLARLERLQASLLEAGQDGLLVADPANIRYLTGFSGTFGRLVVGPTGRFLVTDRRYAVPDSPEPPVYDVVVAHGSRVVEAQLEAVRLCGARKLGFEPGAMAWWDVRALEASWPRRVELIAAGGQVEALRRIKDDRELSATRRAARATEEAVEAVLRAARPGVEERDLAALLASELRRRGDGPPAFEPLLASGPRTARIHGRPSNRRLEDGDLLVVDAGATVEGMAADMCRTIVVGGKPDALQQRAFEAVRAALEAAIAAARPGVTGRKIDAAARKTLLAHGYPLLHDVGHGVGLEVHESPRLAEDSDEILEAGMILAIEPGLYVAGWGGVRLEELVRVTARGPERLTRLQMALA